MTNQHAGASVLKGGLLQCYQLQARVYGARTGTGTGPCAGRLGMLWLSLSFVTGFFVWLPPGGKETHKGSGNLPHANIYITRSPVSLVQGPGVALLEGGEWGWGGFDGIRPCKKPSSPGWSQPASPVLFMSVGCGCYS